MRPDTPIPVPLCAHGIALFNFSVFLIDNLVYLGSCQETKIPSPQYMTLIGICVLQALVNIE